MEGGAEPGGKSEDGVGTCGLDEAIARHNCEYFTPVASIREGMARR